MKTHPYEETNSTKDDFVHYIIYLTLEFQGYFQRLNGLFI